MPSLGPVRGFERMQRPLATVPARGGVNTVVGVSERGTVIAAHFAHFGDVAAERELRILDARRLADLIDEAAEWVGEPGQGDDEVHRIGTVPTDDGRWAVVHTHRPYVGNVLYSEAGLPVLGLEYSRYRAHDLAALLRAAVLKAYPG